MLQTIGVLQMEIEAYEAAYLFLLSIPIIILLTILQLVFFILYNGRLHPMNKILEAVSPKNLDGADEEKELERLASNETISNVDNKFEDDGGMF